MARPVSDPFDALSAADHLNDLMDTALERTPAHVAARQERVASIGGGLSKKDRDAWLNQARHLSDDDLLAVHEGNVKDFLATVNEIKAHTGNGEWFTQAAKAGKVARRWYNNTTRTIFQLFPNGDDAFRFTALLAATSPRVPVDTNLKLAMDIWAAWNKAGRPQNVKGFLHGLAQDWYGAGKTVPVTNSKGEVERIPWGNPPNFYAHLNNAARALTYQGHDWIKEFKLSGPKVNSFYQNLIGNLNAVTNDTWMSYFGGIPQKDLYGKQMGKGEPAGMSMPYAAYSSLVREAASKLNETRLSHEAPWTPAEVQAAVWSFYRTLAKVQGLSTRAAKLGRTQPFSPAEALAAITEGDMADTVNFVSLLANDPDIAKRARSIGLGPEYARFRKVFARFSSQQGKTAGSRAAPSVNPVLEAISRSAGTHQAPFASGRVRQSAATGQVTPAPLSPWIETCLAFLRGTGA
jgi:hypothetical protein